MDPVAVDIRLIRAVLGAELRIAPGRALMARVVAADGHGHGTLSLAGAVIDAQLPAHVRSGDELRLVVRHVSPERVVLGLADQPPAAAAPSVPLPGGGSLHVREEDAGQSTRGGQGDVHTLALRYAAPSLGAVDLDFRLDPRSLSVSVAVPAGRSFELAHGALEELRAALGDSVGRPASVRISPRHDPLDVYA